VSIAGNEKVSGPDSINGTVAAGTIGVDGVVAAGTDDTGELVEGLQYQK
jgi:hypothetical protein